ncbi:MAG: hypothetical protein RL417_1261, partial [Pseudomonadota bacterium]
RRANKSGWEGMSRVIEEKIEREVE